MCFLEASRDCEEGRKGGNDKKATDIRISHGIEENM
jgi:hypothetical protein